MTARRHGAAWGFRTINGSAKRGNGILNSGLYIGRMFLNRQRFIKDPGSSKRASRCNPRSVRVIVADAQDPVALLHPSMAEIYRSKIVALHLALNDEAMRGEATDILRSLIDTILLTPDDGELQIELRGDLAGILAIATNAKGRPGRDGLLSQFELVAGRRNQRDHRFWVAEV